MKYQNVYAPKTGKLAPFKEVLEQWLKLNNRYYKAEGDIISCYTELSCVSHLNAALWSCRSGDWVGLQEYQAEKREISRRQKKTSGRVDLFVKYKKRKYVIEAKRAYINVKSYTSRKLLTKLDDKSWSAWNDVERNIYQDDADNLIAATFFDFQFPIQEKEDEMKYGSRIGEYITKIESEHFDAGAYWFLKSPIVEQNWAYCGTYLALELYQK